MFDCFHKGGILPLMRQVSEVWGEVAYGGNGGGFN